MIERVWQSSRVTLLKISIATHTYVLIYLLTCLWNLVLNLRLSRAAVERSFERVWCQLQAAVDPTGMNCSKRA